MGNRTNAYAFFLANAGYSYDPARETPMDGRRRCAQALADAEERAWRNNCAFAWSVDPEITSAEWEDGDGPFSRTWICTMHDMDGKIVESLGGIDFGPDGTPYRDPYRRVIEAELAASL